MPTVRHQITAPAGVPLTEVRARLRLVVAADGDGLGYVGVRSVGGAVVTTPDDLGFLAWDDVDPTVTEDGLDPHPDMKPAGAMYGLTLSRRDDGFDIPLGDEVTFHVRDVDTDEWVASRLEPAPGQLASPIIGQVVSELDATAAAAGTAAAAVAIDAITAGGEVTGPLDTLVVAPNVVEARTATQLEGLALSDALPVAGDTIKVPAIVDGALANTDWRDMMLYVWGGLAELTIGTTVAYPLDKRIVGGVYDVATGITSLAIDNDTTAVTVRLPHLSTTDPSVRWCPVKITLYGTAQATIGAQSLASVVSDRKVMRAQYSTVIAIPLTDVAGTTAWVVFGDLEGDVVGPSSSTAGRIPSFSGTTGKLVQEQSAITTTQALSVGSIAATTGSQGLSVTDGTNSHGAVTAGASAVGAGLLVKANSTYTYGAATLSIIGLLLGPTASDAPYDWSVTRIGVGVATIGSGFLRATADPISTDDLTRRGWVESQIAAVLTTIVDHKDSVRAATTANITLSGAQTIDGVSVVAGNRVLVKNQSTGSQNGIYVAAAGAWSRSTDADASAEVTAGMTVVVEEGTANGGRVYTLTTANPITLGTTALTFTRLDAGDLVAANNLSDLPSASTARTNLGLGPLATLSTITTSEITDGTITGSDISSSAALSVASLTATSATPLTLGSGTAAHGNWATSHDGTFGTLLSGKKATGDTNANVLLGTTLGTLWGGVGAFIALGSASALPDFAIAYTGPAAALVTGALTSATVSATTSAAGLTRHATNAEAQTGTATNRAVTPAAAAATYVTKVGGGLETVQAHGNTGSTETFDLANGNVHTAAQDQSCTYTLTGFTNSTACSLTIILTSVTGTATWPAAVKWSGGAAPTLSGVTILTFVSVDGGTTIYGSRAGSGYA